MKYKGTSCVYLIHLDKPIRGNNQHYIGYTQDIIQRIATHRSGNKSSAQFLRMAKNMGVGWQLARIWWRAEVDFERDLKRRNAAKRMCPICNPTLYQQDFSDIEPKVLNE